MTSRKQILYQSHEEHYGMISSSSRIYEQRYKQYNYSVAYYSKFDKVINPKLVMRFDCKQINDIQILRLPNKTQRGPNLAKE
jgi:hypothetical protein